MDWSRGEAEWFASLCIPLCLHSRTRPSSMCLTPTLLLTRESLPFSSWGCSISLCPQPHSAVPLKSSRWSGMQPLLSRHRCVGSSCRVAYGQADNLLGMIEQSTKKGHSTANVAFNVQSRLQDINNVAPFLDADELCVLCFHSVPGYHSTEETETRSKHRKK